MVMMIRISGHRDGNADDLELDRLRHHPLQPVGQARHLGVVGDPPSQVAGLADVDRVAPSVEHAVDPRRVWQGFDNRLNRRHAALVAAQRRLQLPQVPHRLPPSRARAPL